MKNILSLISAAGLVYFLLSSGPAYKKRQIILVATRIIDGDTFEGRANDSTFRIRLNAIDAPERGQDFYQVSKQRLGELCMDTPLKVILHNKDRYGRWIADVTNNSNILINARLVEEGLAWHYKKYSNDSSLAKLENAARLQKRGLWINSNPVPPWIKRN